VQLLQLLASNAQLLVLVALLGVLPRITLRLPWHLGVPPALLLLLLLLLLLHLLLLLLLRLLLRLHLLLHLLLLLLLLLALSARGNARGIQCGLHTLRLLVVLVRALAVLAPLLLLPRLLLPLLLLLQQLLLLCACCCWWRGAQLQVVQLAGLQEPAEHLCTRQWHVLGAVSAASTL
jgi:hypothetical protein